MCKLVGSCCNYFVICFFLQFSLSPVESIYTNTLPLIPHQPSFHDLMLSSESCELARLSVSLSHCQDVSVTSGVKACLGA